MTKHDRHFTPYKNPWKGRAKRHHTCLSCRIENTGLNNQQFNSIKWLYKLTQLEYLELFELQEGKCALCNRHVKLHVDHDHDTGEVRGLLCHRCNVGLGYFQDNTQLLYKAIKYLRATIS